MAAALIFYAGRLFLLSSRYQVNIFFWDEWDFKDPTLFQKRSAWQMFVLQHGWHRLGLGAWVEALLDPLFHWNSRAESFIMAGILVAAAGCALWLKVRLVGSISIFDVAIPAILFTPAQWELVFGTPIFSQGPLPLLLILLYCLAWTCKRSFLRYSLILLMNFLAIFTGFGFFVGILTPFLLVVERFSRDPAQRLPRAYFAATLVVCLASVGSFLVGYKPTPGIFCFASFQELPPQEHSLHFYVVFMALMWAHFFALDWTGFLPRVVGKTVLLVLLGGVLYTAWSLLGSSARTLSSAEQKRRLVTLTLMALCLVTCAAIGYFRVCGGMPSALATRYAVYPQIGALGLYIYLSGGQQNLFRRFSIGALVLAVMLASLHVDLEGMAHFRDIKQRWKGCYLKTEDIARCDQVAGFPMHPRRAETYLDEKLRFLKEKHLNLYSE